MVASNTDNYIGNVPPPDRVCGEEIFAGPDVHGSRDLAENDGL
jgi:hypothetical protein